MVVLTNKRQTMALASVLPK